MSAGDLDGHGKSDLVFANPANDHIQALMNYIFMNIQNLSIGLGSHPQFITIAHINQDQFLDIAVVNTWDNNFNVFLGRGNSSCSRKYVYPTETLSLLPIRLLLLI